jgi:hypothetical protein
MLSKELQSKIWLSSAKIKPRMINLNSITQVKRSFTLLMLISSHLFATAQTEKTVRPNTADPLSGAPNNFHFIYTNPSVPQKNKLFLFFPGTGAVPFNYREILKHAANLGYHSIGLSYPNSLAINQICLSSTDTTCHSRARLEVFDGTDRHPDIQVDSNNSIQRRALRLLQYLENNFPGENWGQFYNGNEIIWSKLILSGHSQGGGHAGIISKIHAVERVAMFAAMDWIVLLNRNADWITWNGATAENRYYGFTHEFDESVNFNKLTITWNNYGMGTFGDIVLVDTTNSPYANSRQLYTLLSPANDSTKFHGSIVVDAYTPMASGNPVYAPVWTYMIGGGEELGNAAIHSQTLQIYPNPVVSELRLSPLTSAVITYSIYDLQGRCLQNGTAEDNSIPIYDLRPGMYVLKIDSGRIYRIMRFMKS